MPKPEFSQDNTTSKAAKVGPISLSLLLHLALILVIGGAVVTDQLIPKTSFKPAILGESFDQITDTAMDPEEALADPSGGSSLELPSEAPEMPQSNTSDSTMDVMTTLSNNSPITFSTSTTPSLGIKPGGGQGGTGQGSGKGSGKGPGIGTGNIFGRAAAQVGDLEGTFYDLKQDSKGKSLTFDLPSYHKVVNEWSSKGMKERVVESFFSPETKLFAPQFFFPLMSANEGPKHFKVGDKVKPSFWLVHYKGKAAAPFSGRFRFIGRAGETLMVLWNDKLVLDGSHSYMRNDKASPSSSWKSRDNEDKYPAFNSGAWAKTETLVFGDWIQVNAGEQVQVDIIIGERGGGDFYTFLLWEGPGAQGVKDQATGMMAYPIWTTSFVQADVPDYKPGSQGPPTLRTLEN
jgi:hypothetical protein